MIIINATLQHSNQVQGPIYSKQPNYQKSKTDTGTIN